MRSRSTAARSKSRAAEAACISFAIRPMIRRSWLAMNAANWSTIDAVLLDRHLLRARAAAAPDLAREAGPAGRHRPRVARVRAGADREGPDHQVDGLAHRPDLRVRPEVARARDAVVAGDHDARRLVGHRHRQVRVGLVVAELDVVRRLELLDPGVLELERLEVAPDGRPLDARRREHHVAGALVQAAERLEVVAQALAEVDGLADVQDASVGVTEAVHPG